MILILILILILIKPFIILIPPLACEVSSVLDEEVMLDMAIEVTKGIGFGLLPTIHNHHQLRPPDPSVPPPHPHPPQSPLSPITNASLSPTPVSGGRG